MDVYNVFANEKGKFGLNQKKNKLYGPENISICDYYDVMVKKSFYF